MFLLTIRQLATKKLRLLTTAMSVLLGVAFLAGTLVLTDTVGRTLDHTLADANAGTNVYVTPEPPPSMSASVKPAPASMHRSWIELSGP